LSVILIVRSTLDLLGVQEVRWDKGGSVIAGDFVFLYGKGNGNHHMGTVFFVHRRKVSTIKRVEYFSYRVSHIVLRGRLCNSECACTEYGEM
jgi:hypothetical protein